MAFLIIAVEVFIVCWVLKQIVDIGLAVKNISHAVQELAVKVDSISSSLAANKLSE